MRHGKNSASRRSHRHQSQEILGGQQRRQSNDRLEHRFFGVMRELTDQPTRCIRQLLDCFSDDCAHSHGLVRDECLQCVPGFLMQPRMLGCRQPRNERRQLARQEDANSFIAVGGEHLVHPRRCGGVERERCADGDRSVVRQVDQHIRLGGRTGAEADSGRFIFWHCVRLIHDQAFASRATRQLPRPLRLTSYIAWSARRSRLSTGS